MIIKILFQYSILILILLGFTELNAITYYINFSSGNDSFSGTSINTPWKTISKVNNSTFLYGDSILFKSGEIWKETLDFSSSGNAFIPILIGSYGEGELPIITGVDVYGGWDNPSYWAYEGNNLWSRNQSDNPQRMWINGKEVLRNEQIDSLDGSRYVWAWESSKIYIYSTENPATAFNLIETNVLYNVAKIINKNYITIENIELQGGYSFALAIRGSSNITVRNCRIGSYSREGIFLGENLGVSSTYVTIDNCVLDSKFDFSYGKNKGIDDGILLAAGANDCIIKNCVIKDFGHTAVYLKSLTATDNGVFNNKIFGNIMTGENVTYQRGIGTDGYENKCRDNEFYYNVIKDMTVRSQINGNNNWIHHNIVDGVKNSVVRSWGVAQAFDLQGYGTDLVCHDNKIDNNLIMNCDEPGITFSGNGNNKLNNYVRNNIIYNCGRNSKSGYDNIGILIADSPTIKTNYFENNCVFGKDEDSPAVFLRGEYLTIEQFNNKNSFFDVAQNNIQSNPLIYAFDSENIYLSENSPCIDAGIDVGLLFDYYGNSIFTGSAPDIGIQEYYPNTDIASDKNVVGKFLLNQNYPNPFNPSTIISYTIPESGFVQLRVYDILGKEVAVLVYKEQLSGAHKINFNSGNLPSGIYFYRLISGEFSKTKKLTIVR